MPLVTKTITQSRYTIIILFLGITTMSGIMVSQQQVFAVAGFDNPITLADNGSLGSNRSIAIGADGFPVISYIDSINQNLKIIHCTSSDCSSRDAPIILDDTSGSNSALTSIAIGEDGFPVISYRNNPSGSIFLLKLVHCTSIDCSTFDPSIVLDNLFSGITSTSIAIGADGFPVISYTDDNLDTPLLKLVHCTSIDCSTFDPSILVVSALNTGEFQSIAIGVDGFPVISYFDRTNADLKIVHCINTDCSNTDAPETLDSVSNVVGTFTSIAIGADGFPVISYFDNSNADLKIVHCTSFNCSFFDNPVIIDDAVDITPFTSIAIGNDGNPVVSYRAAANSDLKFVHCTVIDCNSVNTTITLDSVSNVGAAFTSIAIGADGFPVISYFDNSNADLKIVHCTNENCRDIIDTELPVITLNGENFITLEAGIDTYTEQGAIVTDNDPTYSESVIIGGDTVDANIVNTYIVTYNAPADTAGNIPLQITRTINVVTTSPELTFCNDMTIQELIDSGIYNVIDNRDNALGDVLTGTSTRDLILTSNNGDTVFGKGAADCIIGGDKKDSLDGNNGNDTIFGGKGNDTIQGNKGNDKLFGNEGKDTIFGGKGNDTIQGNKGNDKLFGNEGKDTIFGGKGNDTIQGNKGADQLFGDRGKKDTLIGGNGVDTLDGGIGNNDRCDTDNNDNPAISCERTI